MNSITMTSTEQRRLQILAHAIDGSMTLAEAALVLGISLRQARRLKSGLMRDGPEALVHGNRGRTPQRRIADEVRARVVELYRTRYPGFNHQHFTELLAEREEITLSVATVSRLLKEAGYRSPRSVKARQHRARRQRRVAEGMLLQVDGSPYAWLGAQGPVWSLIGAIDDATGAPVAAIFREQEDASGYMLMLRQVVTTKGIPAALYHDGHASFRPPKRLSLEEELSGEPFPTQVQRLLAELGIEAILAHSPQAKGRIENLWRTFQDRLAKELQLARIQTIDEANAFLPPYLVRYAARFAVAPASTEAAWVPLDPATNLDRYFCFKYSRTVAPDNTISFFKRIIQLPPGPDRLSYARATVDVHERLDRTVAVYHAGRQLIIEPPLPADATQPLRARKLARRFAHLTRHPARPADLPDRKAASPMPAATAPPPPAPRLQPTTPHKPPANHPWRTYQPPGQNH